MEGFWKVGKEAAKIPRRFCTGRLATTSTTDRSPEGSPTASVLLPEAFHRKHTQLSPAHIHPSFDSPFSTNNNNNNLLSIPTPFISSTQT